MLDFVRCDAAQGSNGPTPTLPLALTLALTLTRCYATQDLNGIAAALAQMGFTKEGVDTRAFAVDLKEVPRPGDPHPHPHPTLTLTVTLALTLTSTLTSQP